jgi:hypothetical protein
MNRIDGVIPDVDWRRPEDVTEREIDPLSGMLATPYCPNTRSEVYVAGTEPESVCPLHAGSGEPSLFTPEPPIFGDRAAVDDQQRSAAQRQAMEEMQRRAEEQRRRTKEKDNSIRKLLRKIFGN